MLSQNSEEFADVQESVRVVVEFKVQYHRQSDDVERDQNERRYPLFPALLFRARLVVRIGNGEPRLHVFHDFVQGNVFVAFLFRHGRFIGYRSGYVRSGAVFPSHALPERSVVVLVYAACLCHGIRVFKPKIPVVMHRGGFPICFFSFLLLYVRVRPHS